jgi:hypothetical protein
MAPPLGIDSGGGMTVGSREVDANRTEQVYQWCLKDPHRRCRSKAPASPSSSTSAGATITYQPPGKKRDPFTGPLHLVDPIYYRDLLTGYVVAKVNVVDPKTGEVIDQLVDQWLLNDRDDDEYNRHLARCTRRKRKGRARSSSGSPRPPGARHDYHDLESYQLAMAHGPANCFALPSDPSSSPAMHEAARTPARPSAAASAPPTAAPSSPRDAEIAVRKLWNRITRAGRRRRRRQRDAERQAQLSPGRTSSASSTSRPARA